METAAALVPIQRRLLAAATPSHVDPSRLVVTPDVAAQCMGVSLSSVAHVLEVLASVQPREPSSSSSAAAASSSDREILVQDLLQYLFLQTYARPHAQSLLRESTAQEAPFADPLDAAAFLGAPVSPVPSPGPRSPAATGAASPGAGTSPKGSPAKSRTASREWQRAEAEALQAQFVVHHFHALCGLLVEDEAKIGTGGQGGCLLELTPREADRLAFLFQTNAGIAFAEGTRGALSEDADGNLAPTFSAATRLFEGDTPRTVPAVALRDWVARNLAGARGAASTPNSPLRGAATAAAAAARVGTPTRPSVVIENVHKGTAVRREGDVARGASARVAGCHDAVVYLLAPVEYASVIGCTDCVVVVGAVARALRVEQCERLTLIAATRRLQVRNCHEGTFYLGAAEPPLFVGDNRRNAVAPYNTFYEQLETHLQIAGLSTRCAAWDRPVVIGTPGSTPVGLTDASGSPGSPGSPGSAAAEVLPVDKFSPFIVPFRGAPAAAPGTGASPPTQANPFAVPPAYVQALDQKVKAVASLRAALRDAGLDESDKRELQATIQAYFKEWLLASGSMRQVYDLARIERGE